MEMFWNIAFLKMVFILSLINCLTEWNSWLGICINQDRLGWCKSSWYTHKFISCLYKSLSETSGSTGSQGSSFQELIPSYDHPTSSYYLSLDLHVTLAEERGAGNMWRLLKPSSWKWLMLLLWVVSWPELLSCKGTGSIKVISPLNADCPFPPDSSFWCFCWEDLLFALHMEISSVCMEASYS